MAVEKIVIPDIGTSDPVDVIEVLVKPGDTVAVEDSLVTLEGEKATMDVPATAAGVVKSVDVKTGDKVKEGDAIITLTVKGGDESVSSAEKKSSKSETTSKSKSSQKDESSSKTVDIVIPDLGTPDKVDVIEVMLKVGDTVNAEDALLTLEGEKATMDVPAPYAGKITAVKVKVGDTVAEGDVVGAMETNDMVAETPAIPEKSNAETSAPAPAEKQQAASKAASSTNNDNFSFGTEVYAGPAVRRIAREFGVNLKRINGTGDKGRVTKQDVQEFVKQQLKVAESGGGTGFQFPQMPKVDFAKYGAIETKPLSKIKKISGANLHRNWVSIPHITQFEEADITELEAFRQEQKSIAAAQGIRLTPLVFIMKAVVAALKEFPNFNASLDASGENLVLKKYYHIGVAVDTPNGLVVPVIKDVDKKGLYELAKELGEVSQQAREKGLSLAQMQGGCFSISSLGGIGGTAFTPIINAPEVAILGVSKSIRKPVYINDDTNLVPRLMLPLSLSYDHRVIDGAEGARFVVFLASRLADLRTILL